MKSNKALLLGLCFLFEVCVTRGFASGSSHTCAGANGYGQADFPERDGDLEKVDAMALGAQARSGN